MLLVNFIEFTQQGLIREMGGLFAKSLKGQPSQSDIGVSLVMDYLNTAITCSKPLVARVLRQESQNKLKFNKAKTFCANRLTDLRCEERRRVS